MPDDKNQQRFPSDIFLDKGNSKFSNDFKTRLAEQASKMFGLDTGVAQDGDGKNEISRNRQAVFFQARSYLIAKKSANYVEQFEGLYAMMRGLTCSFLAGALYLAGWGLSFHHDQRRLSALLVILLVIGIGGALISTCMTLSLKANVKNAILRLALCLLLTLFCSGFWVSVLQPREFWSKAPAYAEYIFWAGVCFVLIAAGRCFSAYRTFAEMFAQTVWSDFSANLPIQPALVPPDGDDSDES